MLLVFSDGFEPLAQVADTGNLKGFINDLGDATPIAFGFLGAYFFSITALIRGYFRLDLSPELFTLMAYRMLVIIILGLVVQTVWMRWDQGDLSDMSDAGLKTVLFVGGIFPLLLLDYLERTARKLVGSHQSGLGEPWLRISNIEGIHPHQEARLQVAGIEDIENLAMADIPETIVNARLGSQRIVDWIDQAILRLYAHQSFTELREKFGVRTASGFILAYYGHNAPSWGHENFNPEIEPQTQVFEGFDGVEEGSSMHEIFVQIATSCRPTFCVWNIE